MPKHLTRLQEMQINLNLKHEEGLRLINISYYIALDSVAFNNYPGICNLQEFHNIQLKNNYRTDKYCRLFVNITATEMGSELSSLIDNNRFISVLSDDSNGSCLTFCDNEAISSGNFPDSLKLSSIMPVYKKKDTRRNVTIGQ